MVTKIPIDPRKKLFDILYRDSSPDFIKFLRAYEGIPRPSNEWFEVSCELVNGVRADRMRLAISGLHRQDVLRWLSACRIEIPSIQQLLFTNTYCGIGLADYPATSGLSRIKIYSEQYSEHGTAEPEAGKAVHIRRILSLFNIPGDEFARDWEKFGKVRLLCLDRDHLGQVALKVYFGRFPTSQLEDICEAPCEEETSFYESLRQNDLLPETFGVCVRYSPEGRSLKTGFNFQESRVVPYLRMLDHQREASRFFAEFYRIFPDIKLAFLSVQWQPVRTSQFYFKIS